MNSSQHQARKPWRMFAERQQSRTRPNGDPRMVKGASAGSWSLAAPRFSRATLGSWHNRHQINRSGNGKTQSVTTLPETKAQAAKTKQVYACGYKDTTRRLRRDVESASSLLDQYVAEGAAAVQHVQCCQPTS